MSGNLESQKIKASPRTIFVRTLLAGILIFAAARLFGLVVKISLDGLQMDFSSSYTAGESLTAGLSPYVNNILHDPPIWDGIDAYTHSRFLYPPLTAALFQPLAMIPYGAAKIIWTLICLAAVFVAMAATIKISKVTLKVESLLIIGIFICLYHPLLTHIERGQIDAISFLLLVLAIVFMIGQEKKEVIAGILIAMATLIKLHCIFLVPFLILRRKGRVLAGYVAGGVIIVVMTLLINGPGALNDYIFDQIPRITEHGETGTAEMRLSDEVIEEQSLGTKDGVQYSETVFGFTANATLVRPFSDALHKVGIDATDSNFSLIIFTCLFFLFWLWQWRLGDRIRDFIPMQQFAYWQVVLIIILMSAPLTWVMNTIWLMPCIVILIFWYSVLSERKQAYFLALGAIGLIVATFPDNQSFSLLVPYGAGLIKYKYVVAELLLFASLLGFLSGTYNKEEGVKQIIQQP